MENESQNVLEDFEQELLLRKASTGIRFANYLIDIVGFYIFYLLIVFVHLLPSLNQALIDKQEGNDSGGEMAATYLASYVCFFLYYSLWEGATKGRTLGKLITGTQAVKEDGNPITWKDALLRSLSRIVPFEPFSALGVRPWHDKWTETIVIKRRG